MVFTGGFTAGNGGGNQHKNFPTVGTTPNGAIVEKTVEDDIGMNGVISLSLARPDFTTADRIVQTINMRFGNVTFSPSILINFPK